MRLQKALAAAGVASRRTCEEMIARGRVAVNGKTTRTQGVKITPGVDEVRVDGQPVPLFAKPKPIYVMLNKPVGYVSTVSDPHADATVLDLVDEIKTRLFPVGRLDADSDGLLLLTNDGDFALKLTHPRYHVPKIYRVRARGFVDKIAAEKLSQGIDLPDGHTAPADLKYIEYDNSDQTTVVEITMYEGRNRQVRRMFEAIGHPVRTLTRIGFGNLRMGLLNSGTWRNLKKEEIEDLLKLAKPTPTPKKTERRIKPKYFRSRNAAPNPAPENNG